MEYNAEKYKYWQITPFICLNLVAIMAIANWAIFPLRIVWIRIDATSFEVLHRLLLNTSLLQRFILALPEWFLSLIVFILLLFPMLISRGIFSSYNFRQRSMAVLLFLLSSILAWGFMSEVLALQHMTPMTFIDKGKLSSEMMLHLQMLSSHFSYLSSKFLVFQLFWNIYALLQRKLCWSVYGLALLLLYCLPNLAVGNMWLSDVCISVFATALLGYAWTMLTPLFVRLVGEEKALC